MLDHLGIHCADLQASATFYDAVLAPLGAKRVLDYEIAIGYGVDKPDFWLSGMLEGEGSSEDHIAFVAADRETVDAFVEAGRAIGAEVLHEARVWPEYHENYYGGFLRDLDGNNIEAVCHRPG